MRFTSLSLFLVVLTLTAGAQVRYKARHLDYRISLPSQSVNSVSQDKKGFIWICSDDGLIRYDGYEFISYRNIPDDSLSLPHNKVTAVLEDSRGNFWVATLGGGFSLFDRGAGTFRNYRHIPLSSNTIHDNNVTAISEGENGDLWLGTWVGLTRFNIPSGRFYNYFRRDSSYKAAFISWVRELKNQHSGLITAERPGNYTELTKKISITARGTYFIFSLGEKVDVDAFDYGWLLNSRGEIIWGLQSATNYHAGGDLKNRCAAAFINLEPGEYTLRYRSDDSHSPASWNGFKPDFDDLWGIFLVPVSEAERKTGEKMMREVLFTEGLTSHAVTCLSFASGGMLFIGTKNGLSLLDTRKMRFSDAEGIRSGDSFQSNFIYSVFTDNEKATWISDSDGLHRIRQDMRTAEPFPIKADLQTKVITDISDFDSSRLFICCGNGILTVNKKTGIAGELQLTRGTLSRSGYKSAFRDRERSFWLTATGGGITVLNPDQKNFRAALYNSFPVESAALFEGNTVITQTDGMISELRLSETDYSFSPISFPARVNSVWSDSKRLGSVMVSASDGLYEIIRNKTVKKIFSYEKGVDLAVRGANGIIWGSSGSSMLMFREGDNAPEVFIVKPDTLSVIYDFTVTGILPRSGGEVWLSTRAGLALFRPELKSFRIFRDLSERYFEANSFNFISEYEVNDLIAGTRSGGIKIFSPSKERFRSFDKKSGLPSNNVISIIKSSGGGYFTGSDRGLSYFDGKGFISYFIADGLPSENFTPAAIQTAGGYIVMGTENCILFFRPEEIKSNEFVPQAVLTGFSVFNREYYFDKEYSLLNEITLGYSQNVFSLRFSALSFINSSINRYAFKLEGFDEEWNNTGTRREIYYTNLAPGSYTLLVRVSNNDGVWNDNPLKLKITIFPPWYMTWWAYLLYAVILTGVFLIWRRIEINRLRLHNELELRQLETLRLKETDKIKSDFFANISHEFRTPLTLILEPVKKLIELDQGGEKTGLPEIIERNARRLLSLINQMLELSRIESGTVRLKVEHRDVSAFCRGVFAGFEAPAIQKNIEYVFFSPSDKLFIFFDSEKLEKIITNLISNAFKFTESGGRILFSVEPVGERVNFSISDTGKGVAEADQARIFDRFYRVTGAGTYTEGTGIGLALCKELVELHKGRISVKSEPGKGSTFSFWLHSVNDVYTDEEKTADHSSIFSVHDTDLSPGESSDELHTGSAKSEDRDLVLVVDDNNDMRSYIRSVIAADFEVIEAENGFEGLRAAEENFPELIISDIMMPVMDGLDFCSKLRSNRIICHIPVILLTAKAGSDNKIQGLDSGADAYIIKPFESRELLSRVKSLIKNRRSLIENLAGEGLVTLNHRLKGIEGLSLYDREFMEKILTLTEEKYSDTGFTIEEFAHTAGMSLSQLRRKFAAVFKHPPVEFLRIFRLQQARKKLLEGLNVSDAAYTSGFSSLSYFSRSFKAEFGELPSEIIKKD